MKNIYYPLFLLLALSLQAAEQKEDFPGSMQLVYSKQTSEANPYYFRPQYASFRQNYLLTIQKKNPKVELRSNLHSHNISLSNDKYSVIGMDQGIYQITGNLSGQVINETWPAIILTVLTRATEVRYFGNAPDFSFTDFIKIEKNDSLSITVESTEKNGAVCPTDFRFTLNKIENLE